MGALQTGDQFSAFDSVLIDVCHHTLTHFHYIKLTKKLEFTSLISLNLSTKSESVSVSKSGTAVHKDTSTVNGAGELLSGSCILSDYHICVRTAVRVNVLNEKQFTKIYKVTRSSIALICALSHLNVPSVIIIWVSLFQFSHMKLYCNSPSLGTNYSNNLTVLNSTRITPVKLNLQALFFDTTSKKSFQWILLKLKVWYNISKGAIK